MPLKSRSTSGETCWLWFRREGCRHTLQPSPQERWFSSSSTLPIWIELVSSCASKKNHANFLASPVYRQPWIFIPVDKLLLWIFSKAVIWHAVREVNVVSHWRHPMSGSLYATMTLLLPPTLRLSVLAIKLTVRWPKTINASNLFQISILQFNPFLL